LRLDLRPRPATPPRPQNSSTHLIRASCRRLLSFFYGSLESSGRWYGAPVYTRSGIAPGPRPRAASNPPHIASKKTGIARPPIRNRPPLPRCCSSSSATTWTRTGNRTCTFPELHLRLHVRPAQTGSDPAPGHGRHHRPSHRLVRRCASPSAARRTLAPLPSRLKGSVSPCSCRLGTATPSTATPSRRPLTHRVGSQVSIA
jgi:hypothetical protein